jgi:type III secretion system FlhB-like substrate exporter
MPATLYRKTAAGQAEVGSKAHALPPRARSLLIMVDGKRSLSDLRAMLGPAVDESIALLQREGLVEALASAVPQPVPAPAAAVVVDLDRLRREAAHAVTDGDRHQEAKQEFTQGGRGQHLEVKGRPIKARMRELARKRMLAAVPKADLVVMNPTHYAVALKYDEGRMAAPRVVAKGADLLALRIRDLAREHKVPVLQAPPLARALYAHTEVDHEIPAALFAAVAQVLAYVYQLRAAMAGAAMPNDLPAHQPCRPARPAPLAGALSHAGDVRQGRA